VQGLGGRSLNSEWEREAVSYKGITVSGYPNYFKVNGPNTGTGHSSQVSNMEAATDYIVQAICTAFYQKNMTEEVTSLSPEPVTGFILSRKWFRLSDYRLLK
jgi:cation diffusion facilitator CzcD-associated flavoprotein CzcO